MQAKHIRVLVVKQVDGGYEFDDSDAYGDAVTQIDDVTVAIADPSNTVRFTKLSANTDRKLVGVTYRIEGEFADGSTVQTVTGRFRDYTMLECLLIGGNTYTIVETVAPVGYKVDGTPRTFTIDEYGEITFVGDAGSYSVEHAYDESLGQWISVISQVDDPIAVRPGGSGGSAKPNPTETEPDSKGDSKTDTEAKPNSDSKSQTKSDTSGTSSASGIKSGTSASTSPGTTTGSGTTTVGSTTGTTTAAGQDQTSRTSLSQTGDALVPPTLLAIFTALGAGSVALGVRRKSRRRKR